MCFFKQKELTLNTKYCKIILEDRGGTFKMKNMKDNRGFTLIELLAVIVILAIVMVLASSSILPFMGNAARDSFALEANGVIDAASNAISLITVGSIDSDNGSYGNQTIKDNTNNKNFKHNNDKSQYCFSLDYLVEFGLFDLKEESLASYGGKGKYEGAVVASKNSNAYTYTVYLSNGEYMVVHATNTVEKEGKGNNSVKTYSSSFSNKDCSTITLTDVS